MTTNCMPETPQPRAPRVLVRPRLRFVGGVCAGFADHTGVPVGLVRAVTVALAVCGGAGALLYAWLWTTTPSAESAPITRADAPTPPAASTAARTHSPTAPPVPPAAPPTPPPPASSFAEWREKVVAHTQNEQFRTGQQAAHETAQALRRRPITEILLGFALLAVGGALVLGRLGVDVPLGIVIPAIVVLAGVALAWRQFADMRTGTAGSGMLVRTLAALVFVALGILLFFVTGSAPNVWTVIFASAAVLLGVGLVVAPWAIRLARDLADERAARARETERAEIAAHLHDSVLQTLALIQQKAGPQSDAARIARAQERELREWLFTGGPAMGSDLADELRSVAALLEAEHSVRFDIVTAGEAPSSFAEALLAAAREAMLNAARHAGGDVSVYVESAPGSIEIIVTDRGPGFDVDATPSDRFGVRESIIGRMHRAGGSARIGSGPGGRGTSVTLGVSAGAPRAAQTTDAQEPTNE